MFQIKIPRKITRDLSKILSRHLKAGDVVGLSGNLGVGKTTLVKQISKLWKTGASVTSPTFTLVQSYPVRPHKTNYNLYHIDFYRLESEEEAKQIGLEEIFNDPKGIVFIEWADKFPNILPAKVLMIRLEYK